jgi:hypothetical protein
MTQYNLISANSSSVAAPASWQLPGCIGGGSRSGLGTRRNQVLPGEKKYANILALQSNRSLFLADVFVNEPRGVF